MGSLSPKSPNFWVLVASVLAAMGLVVSGVGWVAHASWLRIVGMALLVPLIVGGLGLLLIVIPFLIVANHWKNKPPPKTRKDNGIGKFVLLFGLLLVGTSGNIAIGEFPFAASKVATGETYSVAFQTELKVTSYPGLSRAAHFQAANGNLLRMMEGDAQFAQSMRGMGINVKKDRYGSRPAHFTGWLDLASRCAVRYNAACPAFTTYGRKYLLGYAAPGRSRWLFDLGAIRMILLEIIRDLDSLDEGSTIYAGEPWMAQSQVVVAPEPDSGGLPPDGQKLGLKYFLEVFLAREFLEGWVANLQREPTLEEKCARLIKYAATDA